MQKKKIFVGGVKRRRTPAGLLVRGKIFEKNNMVSNDSKLPNSARNAIKKFFLVAAENGGGRRERRSRRRFLNSNIFYLPT